MAERDEVYLYLRSSVKPVFDVNTVSHFHTYFGNPILLSDGVTYEAGVVKLMYPVTRKTIYDGNFEFYSFVHKRVQRATITTGNYDDPRAMAHTLNTTLGPDAPYYVWSVDLNEKHFFLQCNPAPGSLAAPYCKLSNNLRIYTGLLQTIQRAGTFQSEKVYDLTGGTEHIYVYSDLIGPTNIGDTVAPLMMICGYGAPSNFSHVEHEVRQICYFPMRDITILNSVDIQLKTGDGDFYPFTSGEVIVLIHIRPKDSRI